jgi:serpin B
MQALAMTWNGAAGQTRQAMTAALRLDGLTADDVNRSERTLTELLRQTSPGVQTSVANSLWLQQGWPFRQPFLNAVKDAYGASLNERQLTKPSVRKEINSWVSKQTKGRIPSIVDEPIAELSKLLLVNALYMKAAWEQPFEKGATKDGDFRLGDGTVRRVPMMHKSGRFRYEEGESYQAVQLPYGNGQLAMTIVLPKPDSDRKALEAQLFADPAWWVQPFQSAGGELALPRFHAETSLKLEDTLAAMGMAPAFDPNAADFSAMADTSRAPLYISRVLHKTYLDVAEQGTEAAAATAVEMRAGSAPAPAKSRFQMTVDRPFWFAIVDEQSHVLLFAGSIERL